jgi:SAM-dependent methyltransferase
VFNQYPVNKKLKTYEVETPEFWNDIYDNGTPAWGYDPAYFLEKCIQRFPDNAKILDIGCGSGRNSVYLNSLGYDVVGIDISQSAINQAKEVNSTCIFYCIDALNETLDEHFDVIIDFGLFHFIPYEHRDKYVYNIESMLVNNGLYCNQSGRLIPSNPIIGNNYVPPQLEKQELLDAFKNFSIEILVEDILPPFKNYGKYPCWNLLTRKTEKQQ